MNLVFADTSFYVALVSPADAYHRAAINAGSILDNRPTRIVTTDFVLLEVGNFFSEPTRRSLFTRLLKDIRADRRTKVIPASRRLLDEGLDLFDRRPDKAWSLTDCTSFAVMKRLGARTALTADRHFKQAGFEALLR